MSRYEDATFEKIKQDMRQHVGEEVYKLYEDLIDISIRIVVTSIARKYEDEQEYEASLDKVMGNVINFVALVVMQLNEFGKGNNEGPFIDLFEQIVTKQYQTV